MKQLICMEFKAKKFIINHVYLTLSSLASMCSYVASVDLVVCQHPNYLFICYIDFNIPEITWSNDDFGLSYYSNSVLCFHCIAELFAVNGFYQFNNILNSHDSLLDLVFCNMPCISVSPSLLQFPLTYTILIFFCLNVNLHRFLLRMLLILFKMFVNPY